MPSPKVVRFVEDDKHPDSDPTLYPSVAHIAVPLYPNGTVSPYPSAVASPGVHNNYIPTPPSTLSDHLVHPALAFPTAHMLILYHLSEPVDSESIDPSLLSQAALSIPGPMHIACKGLPWGAVVRPRQNKGRVTIDDVLKELYRFMQLTVSQDELNRARSQLGDVLYAQILNAWQERDPERGWVKRLDFLMGKTRFVGLELVKNRWRLHVA